MTDLEVDTPGPRFHPNMGRIAPFLGFSIGAIHRPMPGFPVNVSSANIISWSGKLTPSIIDDEALTEVMFPHSPKALNLRLEGTGKVMMEKLLP